MELRTRDNQLTLGSAFKLLAVAFLVAFGSLFALILLMLLIIGLATGQMLVNGEIIEGRGAVLAAMAPFLIFAPLLLAIQAVMFGGFLTAGLWLYRLRRPLRVVTEGTDS